VDTQQAATPKCEAKRHETSGHSHDHMAVPLSGYSASIFAGAASREVQDALPQQASVLELGRTYNALFLHKIEASTKTSCTF